MKNGKGFCLGQQNKETKDDYRMKDIKDNSNLVNKNLLLFDLKKATRNYFSGNITCTLITGFY